MNLVQVGKLTEDEAREYLEKLRWPNSPRCVHCKAENVTKMNGEKHRPGTFQCNACREQFSVTVGSVMEDSHISLQKWVMAFHLMCSSKKGISALQLQRELGLGSYRSAWHMCHRIRLAMKDITPGPVLEGMVEVDETYVGGKPRKGTGTHKRGRGTAKVPVMVLVQRDGSARAKPVENVSADTLKDAIRETVQPESTIITDELASYAGIGSEFAGGHETVNHSRGEYARGSIYTNTAESFFALLKRGVYGVFHHVSKHHLRRYCDEFSFRWDNRKVTDGVRTETAIRGAAGKRLAYQKTSERITEAMDKVNLGYA